MRSNDFSRNENKYKENIFEVDKYIVHFVCSMEDALLLESKLPGVPLGGPYSAVAHSGSTNTKTQDHLHIYKNRNKIFAINKDGTAHDASHGARIPSKVASAIKKCYPDVVLPADNIIECLNEAQQLKLLVETETVSRR